MFTNHINKFITIAILSFSTYKSQAQMFSDGFGSFAWSVGGHVGKRIMGEALFGVGNYKHDSGFLHLHSSTTLLAGSEYNFSSKKPLFGPKITFNGNGLLCIGSSLIYFTDGQVGSLYMAPHLGISVDNQNPIADIRLGYNIPLMNQHLKERINHFTVSFILVFVRD